MPNQPLIEEAMHPSTRKLIATLDAQNLEYFNERAGKSQAVIIEEALVAQHNLAGFKAEWSKS